MDAERDKREVREKMYFWTVMLERFVMVYMERLIK